MSFEDAPKLESHPADALFEEFGFPGLGDVKRNYKDRTIQLRDYFDQPDVNPVARNIFDIVKSGDTTHPDYQVSRDILITYVETFAAEAGITRI
jgi:hypothetical protein